MWKIIGLAFEALILLLLFCSYIRTEILFLWTSWMLFGHPCPFHCITAIGQTFCPLCVKDDWGAA